MADLNKITVKKTDIVMRHCDSCGTTTAHVGKKDGTKEVVGFQSTTNIQPFSLCIQCFVDMNDVR